MSQRVSGVSEHGEKCSRRLFWKHLGVCLLLVGSLWIWRSVVIAQAESVSVDDDYHLARGLAYWHGEVKKFLEINDPPFGAAISVIPALFDRGIPKSSWVDHGVSPYISNETLIWIAVWKTVLFLPVVGLLFTVAWRLYGALSAWLAVILVSLEPTFAAHVPVACTDGIGASAYFTGVIAWGWFFEKPSWRRTAVVGPLTGFAMNCKQSCVLLPGVALALAVIFWVWMPWRAGQRSELRTQGKQRLGYLAGAAALAFLAVWAATRFDVSYPHVPWVWHWPEIPPDWVLRVTSVKMPAGLYVSSVLDSIALSRSSRHAWLFGKYSAMGWWYYFPAVATLKVPLGYWAIGVLAVVSLAWRKASRGEVSVLVGFLAAVVLLINSPINIGFRHAMPAYLCAMLLMARVLAPVTRSGWYAGHRWLSQAIAAGVVCAVTGSWVHSLGYHPFYLSYVNRRVDKPWMLISDSNLDWGRGMKAVGQWLEEHVPRSGAGRPVYLVSGGPMRQDWLRGYAPLHVDHYHLPTSGLLLVSVNWISGQYDPTRGMRKLREIEPLAIIAHGTLVYDLDLLGGGKPFDWYVPPPRQEMTVHSRRPATQP